MSTLIDRVERQVDMLTDAIVDRHEKIAQSLGERPFGATAESKKDKIDRYLRIRDDVYEWQRLIQQHGEDEVKKVALDMERILKEK